MALNVVALLSLLDGPPPAHQQNTGEKSGHAVQIRKVEGDRQVQPKPAGNLDPADNPNSPHYYEGQDLLAQQSMANSTISIVDLTKLSLALSVVGALAILWTLMETRKGVKASQDMVVADRAWLTPDGYELADMRQSEIGGICYPQVFGVARRWRNTGRSPALEVAVFTDQKIVPRDAPVPEFARDLKEGHYVAGPDNFIAGLSMGISSPDLEMLRLKKIDWYVYSIASYNDTYPKTPRRISEWCTKVEMNGFIRNPSDGTLGGPNFTVQSTGPQNTTS